jgi:hypothetical protein
VGWIRRGECHVTWVGCGHVEARPIEGYGLGRRDDGDRILSDVRDLWDRVKISIPAVPINLVV